MKLHPKCITSFVHMAWNCRAHFASLVHMAWNCRAHFGCSSNETSPKVYHKLCAYGMKLQSTLWMQFEWNCIQSAIWVPLCFIFHTLLEQATSTSIRPRRVKRPMQQRRAHNPMVTRPINAEQHKLNNSCRYMFRHVNSCTYIIHDVPHNAWAGHFHIHPPQTC